MACWGLANNRNAVVIMRMTICVFMISVVMVWCEREEDVMKAVKDMCEAGDYKRTCVESVSESAGNITDTRKLIEVAFEVGMKKMREAGRRAKYLEEVEHEHRARKALGDCTELIKLSQLAVKRSLEKMKGLEMAKVEEGLEDLRVWLTAASTYQDTCLDALTGDAADKMTRSLKVSRRMTSNSLAIVTDLSTVLRPFERRLDMRRLISNDHDNVVFVVAKDGTGDFTTIRDCLSQIPRHSRERVVVRVRAGVYHEVVEIGHSMTHVVLVGDGPHTTKITGRRNYMDGMTTFRTWSFAVTGDFFTAKNICFENTGKAQGVAVRVQSDMCMFYNCIIQGYEDALYAHTNRQFYRECVISGSVDLVWGNAAAVFQNCSFEVGMAGEQGSVVTAHGRSEKRQPTGFVIQGSTFAGAGRQDTYLGRPRKGFSRTIIMDSYMADLIHPDGWLPLGISTCEYAELGNRGPGAHPNNPNRRQLTIQDANNYYNPDTFIQANHWINTNTSGVPYNSHF